MKPGFVICRPKMPGYLQARARYRTPCGGWTLDPKLALQFPCRESAVQWLERRWHTRRMLERHLVLDLSTLA